MRYPVSMTGSGRKPKGSRIIGAALAGLASGLAAALPRKERIKALAEAAERLAPEARIETERGPIRFACATRAAARMPLSFFHHEPETRSWIDRHVRPGEVFWDVGANVGTFALYAAKAREARVIAFEPSAQTFGLLNRNIALNGLGGQVAAYCAALTDRTGLGVFHLTSASAGEALHAYGTAENLRGRFAPAFSQAVIGVAGAEFCARFGAPPPRHVKIDVDGGELPVLSGLEPLLPEVASLLIELEEAHATAQTVAACEAILHRAGLVEDPAYRSSWNRVFIRAEPMAAAPAHAAASA